MSRIIALAAVIALAAPAAALAGDREDLGALLDSFLANAGQRSAHERFWGEDLVYTSSSGARFGKADILAGMQDDDSRTDSADAPVYSAADVDIRLYDDMAVVAFRLVATDADGGEQYYFNTGTFVRREGRWEVVAWQATGIPE